LHILLFQDAIQVSIMEFSIEEFAFAFTFFIDERVKEKYASYEIFCLEEIEEFPIYE